MASLTYAQSGVSIEAGDELVRRIGKMVGAQNRKRVRSHIGGYASLFELNRDQWLAASTDGVGTKLVLAQELGIHHTVGIDLVAMCVNDLVCVGAEPLFFLDYFSTGKLDPNVAAQVIKGIVKGCTESGCLLVGGETAEHPGVHGQGYDLAGFAVGSVHPKKVLPTKVKVGDVLLGLPSSGPHSNGFSLLRKLLPSKGPKRKALAKELLKPTKLYVKPLLPLVRKGWIRGMSHITGSGFLNVPRMGEHVSYEVSLPKGPKIFDWICEASGLALDELGQTFNLGMGMVLAVDPRNEARVRKALPGCRRLGEVVRRQGKTSLVRVRYRGQESVFR